MRTKWEILESRLGDLREQVAQVESYLAGMEGTPCKLVCDRCGTFLETEADFAKHFVVPDERFLNLGNCESLCAGSGKPVGSGSRCETCGTSFGFPHVSNLVVGKLSPKHNMEGFLR